MKIDILAILYCVFDTNYWSEKKIQNWAEQVILKLEKNPQLWLIDIYLGEPPSLSISRAIKENQTFLPDEIDRVLVGLICMNNKENRICNDTKIKQIAENIDAYESSFLSFEMLEKIEEHSSVCEECEQLAYKYINYLLEYEYNDSDMLLLEY